MKVIFRLLILFLLSVVNVNAQDITISSTDLVNLKIEIKQLKDSIKNLNDTISFKNSIIESNIKSFNEKVTELDSLRLDFITIKSEKETNDSIILSLQSSEDTFNEQLQIMQETMDRNTAKLANGRLYFRYSDNLVQLSIQSLLEIKTESVKKYFEQVLKLLQGYKDYSEDVKNTFSWSIPYLDNLLNVAKSIISRHNPVESEFANFSPLIEML